MERAWFLEVGGVQVGPLTNRQLASMARSGKLDPEDIVWAADVPRGPARRFHGLFATDASAPGTPPPASPSSVSPTGRGHATPPIAPGISRSPRQVGAGRSRESPSSDSASTVTGKETLAKFFAERQTARLIRPAIVLTLPIHALLLGGWIALLIWSEGHPFFSSRWTRFYFVALPAAIAAFLVGGYAIFLAKKWLEKRQRGIADDRINKEALAACPQSQWPTGIRRFLDGMSMKIHRRRFGTWKFSDSHGEVVAILEGDLGIGGTAALLAAGSERKVLLRIADGKSVHDPFGRQIASAVRIDEQLTQKSWYELRDPSDAVLANCFIEPSWWRRFLCISTQLTLLPGSSTSILDFSRSSMFSRRLRGTAQCWPDEWSQEQRLAVIVLRALSCRWWSAW